jgi:hypothetical protein
VVEKNCAALVMANCGYQSIYCLGFCAVVGTR